MDDFMYKKHWFTFNKENVKNNRRGKRFKFHKDSTCRVICTIFDDDLQLVAAGSAWCHVVDKFSLSRGRKLALHRALLGFHLTKKQRVKVWKKYLKVFSYD